jgi:hypothetical protein
VTEHGSRRRHLADSLIALSSMISKSNARSSSISATTTLCLFGPLDLRVLPCSEPSPPSSTPSKGPVANSDDEPGEALMNAEIGPPTSRPTPGADLIAGADVDAGSREGKSPRVGGGSLERTASAGLVGLASGASCETSETGEKVRRCEVACSGGWDGWEGFEGSGGRWISKHPRVRT